MRWSRDLSVRQLHPYRRVVAGFLPAADMAIDLRISEIVDVPNFVVTAYCPLGIFD